MAKRTTKPEPQTTATAPVDPGARAAVAQQAAAELAPAPLEQAQAEVQQQPAAPPPSPEEYEKRLRAAVRPLIMVGAMVGKRYELPSPTPAELEDGAQQFAHELAPVLYPAAPRLVGALGFVGAIASFFLRPALYPPEAK